MTPASRAQIRASGTAAALDLVGIAEPVSERVIVVGQALGKINAADMLPPVYPRARGGTRHERASRLHDGGLSPRTRGNLDLIEVGLPFEPDAHCT